MILEVADIRIPPGKNAEFEVAIAQGLATVIAHAQGLSSPTRCSAASSRPSATS